MIWKSSHFRFSISDFRFTRKRTLQQGPIKNQKSKIKNSPLLSHPWTLRILAWALGLVLLWAALPKIADPPAFAQALHGFDLLPDPALAPLALALPWLELWLSMALLVGVARRSAALLALALLLTFSGALGWNLAQGRAVDCGCFGSGAAKSTEERFLEMKLGLGRNLILGLLAMYLVMGKKQNLAADDADDAD